MSSNRMVLNAGVVLVLALGLLLNPLCAGIVRGISTTFVISQFQVAGATAADEFIEIHNVSGHSLSLDGYRLVYRTDGSSTDGLMFSFASVNLPAGGFYLLANAGFDGGVPWDATYSGALSAAGAGIGLREPGGALVDSVGYGSGTNTLTEGAKTSAPGANQSKARAAQGCTDSDNNAADFLLLNPAAARNSATAASLCVPLDLAPSVVSTDPADQETGVPVGTGIAIQFSEAVSFGGQDSFSISCAGAPQDAVADGGGTEYSLLPVVPLPSGAACTVTILAEGVTDLDGWSDHPEVDHVFTFDTALPDDPPELLGHSPDASEADVGVGENIILDFSEPVTLSEGFASITCGGGVHDFVVDDTGNPQIILDPVEDFAFGDSCNVSLLAQNVTDLDDIPDEMSSDHSWSFSTEYDQAPFVSGTSPLDGETGVSIDTDITVIFSEPVIFDAGWITLTCSRSGDHPLILLSGPADATVVLDPVSTFLFAEQCTLVIDPDKVHDQDSNDPYDVMPLQVSWIFETQIPAFRSFIGFIMAGGVVP